MSNLARAQGALPSLDKARTLLTQCRAVKEVMQIKALAQAVASCSASEEARDEAAAIVLLSKARIGELDLLTTLIEQSTVPGEHVIDPFCGSGSTGVAAVRGKRRFTGIELDKTWADVARGRIGHA